MRADRTGGRHAAGPSQDEPEVLGVLFEPDGPEPGGASSPGYEYGFTDVPAESPGPSRALTVALVTLGVVVVLAVLAVSIAFATGGPDGSPHPQAVITPTSLASVALPTPSLSDTATDQNALPLPTLPPPSSSHRAAPRSSAAASTAPAVSSSQVPVPVARTVTPRKVFVPPVDALPTYGPGSRSTSTSTSPKPPPSNGSSAPVGVVQAQPGARYLGAGCARRCFYLHVSLTGFAAGLHHLDCLDGVTGRVLASATVLATDLPQACWGNRGEPVFAVVDKSVRSLTVVL